MFFKAGLVGLMCCLSLSAFAETEEDIASFQMFVLREGHMAVLLDKQCKVLTKNEHATMVKGLKHLQQAAMEGKIVAARLTKEDIQETEDFGNDVVGRGLPCNDKVEGIIRDASDKLHHFESVSTNPEVKKANNEWVRYRRAASLNRKCHFYVDEMTSIFDKRADEALQRLLKIVPNYAHQTSLDAAALAKAVEEAPDDICLDRDLKQFVTTYAWIATDTFARTVVLAPDCTQDVRCDLPSTLFKKKD